MHSSSSMTPTSNEHQWFGFFDSSIQSLLPIYTPSLQSNETNYLLGRISHNDDTIKPIFWFLIFWWRFYDIHLVRAARFSNTSTNVHYNASIVRTITTTTKNHLHFYSIFNVILTGLGRWPQNVHSNSCPLIKIFCETTTRMFAATRFVTSQTISKNTNCRPNDVYDLSLLTCHICLHKHKLERMINLFAYVSGLQKTKNKKQTHTKMFTNCKCKFMAAGAMCVRTKVQKTKNKYKSSREYTLCQLNLVSN